VFKSGTYPHYVCIVPFKIVREPDLEDCIIYRVSNDTESMSFGFSRTLLTIWGNPSTEELHQFMEAYIGKHGFSKEKIFRSNAGEGGIKSFLHRLRQP
jgi:hypothetical protein